MPENARSSGLSEATSKLASAFDLRPWLMKKGETLYVTSDDFTDFRHQFEVTPVRARRNPLKLELITEEAEMFRASVSSRWRRRPASWCRAPHP